MPTIFAMPPPEYYRDRYVGLVLVALAAAWFVWWTAGRRDDRRRRPGLGWLALAAGPVIGLALALLTESVFEVPLLDVWYQRSVFTGMGLIAGTIAAAFFACSATLAPSPEGLAKHPLDDLS